jgi:hypothetical protein
LLQNLLNISIIIGNFKFLQIEYDLKLIYIANDISNDFYKILQNYIVNYILTDKELGRVKALYKSQNEFRNKIFKNKYKSLILE